MGWRSVITNHSLALQAKIGSVIVNERAIALPYGIGRASCSLSSSPVS